MSKFFGHNKYIGTTLATAACLALLSASPLPALSEAVAPQADQTQSSAPQDQPVVLQGGVRHKEVLPPVPMGLMAGAKYDDSSLPKTGDGIWIPIPDWLAGTWQYTTENVTGMTNYTKENFTPPPYTIKNEAQKTMGQQKDKSGQIWHYLKAPYSYEAKLNHGVLSYVRVNIAEPISSDQNAVRLRLVGMDTQVKQKTQVVTATDQSEDFNLYTPLDKNRMLCSGSAKHFDMNGQPTMDMVSNMIAKLVKPFETIDEQDGVNLKESFAAFLASKGKADLIPTD